MYPIFSLLELDLVFHSSLTLMKSTLCVCADRFSHVWLFATLWTVPSRPLCPGDSPGKNTRVGWHVLLREPSWIRGQTPVSFVSCIDKQVLCYSRHLGSPWNYKHKKNWKLLFQEISSEYHYERFFPSAEKIAYNFSKQCLQIERNSTKKKKILFLSLTEKKFSKPQSLF